MTDYLRFWLHCVDLPLVGSFGGFLWASASFGAKVVWRGKLLMRGKRRKLRT